MCRNIKQLYNFKPHATNDEMNAAALQFVRKVSGFHKPSAANEASFNHAVDEVTHLMHHLFETLVTQASPRDREIEAAKTRARSAQRFRA